MRQIACNNVTLGYEGKLVSNQVSFEIKQGEYWCVVGQNGTGKSTMIKTLLGLKIPIEGEIRFENGVESSQIGYLPQQTTIQKDFPATVYEVVRSGFLSQCGLRPFFNKKEREETRNVMKRLGIEGLKDKCYRELSGGQQQRVLLARALCASQKILVLDEPVSGLDHNITKELYGILAQINKIDGITIVMVSHDLSAAITHATHILHMDKTPLYVGEKDGYVKVASQFWGEREMVW